MSRYVPQRGDIASLGAGTTLVLTPREYNAHGLVLACAISASEKGRRFEVALPGSIRTAGVVIADQLRSFDWRARGIEFRETAPDELVDEVLARIGALLGM